MRIFMYKWFASLIQRYKNTVKDNEDTKNLYNAKKHALLALAHWKKCNEKSDLHIQIQNTNTYVRLGK